MRFDIEESKDIASCGPYPLDHLIAEGATAQLFASTAPDDGRPCLIKRAKRTDIATREAFVREFQIGGRRRQPLLGHVRDHGCDSTGRPFSVLTPHPGTPLRAGEAPLSAEAWLQLGLQLARALAALHRAGWVHGDVSLANVLQAADGSIQLIDFGLAGAIGTPRGERVGGTLSTMAPETLAGVPLEPSADLYGLGALLYERACGRFPIHAESPSAHWAALLHDAPPALETLAPDLPAFACALVMRCLAKDAAARPASAEAFIRAWMAGLEADALGPAEGEWQESAALRAWEGHRQQRGLFAFLGEPGLGKSRHLAEAFWRLRAAQHFAVRLTGTAGEAPYGAFGRLWRWLAGQHSAWAPLDAQEARVLSALWPTGPQAVPAGFLSVDTAAETPAVLCRLLQQRLVQFPACLHILVDDWEILDAASRALFEQLWQLPDTPAHWLVSGQRAPCGATTWALQPFSPAQALRWLESMSSGPFDRARAARLAAACGGHPGWLQEAWHTGNAPTERPIALTERHEARYRALSEPARQLAAVLALAQEPLPLRTAATVLASVQTARRPTPTGITEAEQVLLPAFPHETAFAELTSAGLANGHRAAAQLDAGSWPGWLVERLDGTERAELAFALYRHLATPEPVPLARRHRLGWLAHWSLRPELAAEAGHEAGRALAACFANEDALGHFERALAALDTPGPHPASHQLARVALWAARADIWRLTGRSREACAAYEACLAEAPEAPEVGRWLVSLGKARQTLNDYAEAAWALEAGRDWLERRLHEEPEAPATRREHLRALTTLGRVRYFQGKLASCRTCYEAALAAARASAAPTFEAEALSFLGELDVADPEQAARGFARLASALALREALGDRLGRADTHMLLGNAHYARGHFAQACEHFAAQLGLAREVGHAQDAAYASFNLALCEAERGDWRKAAGWLVDVRLPEDRFLAGLVASLDALAQTHLGEAAAALRRLAEARAIETEPGTGPLRAYARLFESERHLFFGAWEPAHAALGEARRALEGGQAPEMALKALALEGEIAARRGDDAALDSALAALRARCAALPDSGWLARAERLVALRDESRLPDARARAERADLPGLEAELATREPGRSARALALAERLSLPDALGRACLARAAELAEAGEPMLAERLVQRGEELWGLLAHPLDAAGRHAFYAHPERAALRERLARTPKAARDQRRLALLIELGRALGAARDLERVLDLARRFACEVCQAERCLVWIADADGAWRLRGEHAPYARTILERVRAQGRGLCLLDTHEAPDASRSLLDLEVRSVMCVPLTVEGTARGALYVDSRVANGTFRPDDLALLEAIAGQVAVALDNTRLNTALEAEIAHQADYIRRLEESEGLVRHLEELDRLRGEHFQAASHDLRAPLASIQASCQALSRGLFGPLAPAQAEAVSGVWHSGRRLLGLIDGILDAAQLEGGRLLLHPRPVSLARPVGEAADMLSALAEAKGLALRLDLAAFAALPPARGDERRVLQIVLNLLANAIKYTDAGGVTLEPARSLARHVGFSVRDTGPGLPPERERAPFVRYGAQGQSPSAGSSGLGLWLVQGLVELHEGRIDVRSAPGRGSCFTVLLPRWEAPR